MKRTTSFWLRLMSAVSLVGILLVVSLNVRQKDHVAEQPASHVATPSQPVQRRYTEEELKRFWNDQCKVVEEFVLHGQFRVPELSERYHTLHALVVERYHSSFRANWVMDYDPASVDTITGCSVKDGAPQIEVMLAKAADLSIEYRARGDRQWKERLENSLVVGILHELDHLTCEGATPPAQQPPFDVRVEAERRAWAQTCEHTLRVLIERYNAPLGTSEELYYLKWVNAGRNLDSPQWIEAMREAYGSLRR